MQDPETFRSSRKDPLEIFNGLKHFARPAYDRRQRVFGDVDWKLDAIADHRVEPLEHRTAACQHDAAFEDVGSQFGRRSFEATQDGSRNLGHRVTERLANVF
jgi:hypothetical protein